MYANLLYEPAFGPGTMAVPSWRHSPAIGGRIYMDPQTAFSGDKLAMSIDVPAGAAEDAEGVLVNRGVGGIGLHLEGGQPYLVEFWAVHTGVAVVELRDSTVNETLARHEITIQPPAVAPSTWARYKFTIIPSRSTNCTGIDWGADPTIDCGAKHGTLAMQVCVRCGGEFRLGVKGHGSLAFGYASLMPGSWGVLQAKDGSDLPVLKSAAHVLRTMGTRSMRSGGTVSQGLRWKDWRGTVWNRPSSQQTWGSSSIGGWGPFEVLAMAEALDIEAVLTLDDNSNSADDLADLVGKNIAQCPAFSLDNSGIAKVEYCWGDNSTYWGRLRESDGHPMFFNVSTFEIGNEQVPCP